MNVRYKKLGKIYTIKKIKRSEAKKLLKVTDDAILIVGLFKKDKLVGVDAMYRLSKKELKKHYSSMGIKSDSVLKHDKNFTSKIKDDPEIITFFTSGAFKISKKKFPKVCYSLLTVPKKAKKSKAAS